MAELNKQNDSLDIGLFKKAIDEMVIKNDVSWRETSNYYYSTRKTKEYTKEEVTQILNSGSILA
jgi:hypothetical protein